MIQLQNTEMNFIMVVDILSSIYIYNIYVYTYIYDVRLYCITQFYFGFISFFILFIYYLIILLTEEDIYIYIQIYCFLSKLGWLKHEPSPYDSKHRGEPVDLHP